jgi:hypothetical protein
MLLSLLGLLGCRRSAPPPREAGVSRELRYPVLLVGQAALDVRDSEEALTSITGASSLNLNERAILDSDGRLFAVESAVPVAGQRSPMWDMGTSARRFAVQVSAPRRPSWPEIQDLVLAEVRSPRSTWAGDERAVRKVRSLTSVPTLIEASRESWRWSRD